ncbi:MAG TPA: MerR family transcriptional regulator [Candidatus Limnocylindrales bacterium]|nr:MerR family transcriptional regulator [Candidatus Limnocylindrales bacterium]
MLTIGPFSRIAGVSPKVLRTYDALGLFRPVWLERDSGYRYYSPAQLPEIRRILALRDLGIGLAEITRLVGGGADLGEALARRRAELERERREVDRRLAALEIQVAAEGAEAGIGDVVLRPIGGELVASIRIDPRFEMIELTFNEIEAHVRDLGRRARRPPGIIEIGDESIEVYVPLTRSIAEAGRIRCERLPAIRAATIIVRGGYDRLAGAREALGRWVGAAGLTAAGPIRIVYLQYGAARDLRIPSGYVVLEPADYVTELQLPVD